MRGHLFYVWGREAAGQPVSKKRERKKKKKPHGLFLGLDLFKGI